MRENCTSGSERGKPRKGLTYLPNFMGRNLPQAQENPGILRHKGELFFKEMPKDGQDVFLFSNYSLRTA